MSLAQNDLMDDSGTTADANGAGVIIPMDAGSVQLIVAGQAVSDLASAVKELVDNALDAGAKTINIRLFNQGIDVVEISDDGSGVPMSSRPFMARKHATSKIRSFQDIYSNHTTTLGFRGEALFCLANISEKLTVVTRTADDELGQKIDYQRDGEVKKESVTMVPRTIGTTVTVSKLFHALPVRRSDMIKRIKAQRAKVVSMIQGYGILCLGVRFNLVDVVKKGNVHREEIKLSTTNSTTQVEQTVSSMMGSRFLSGLTRVWVDLTSAIQDSHGEWKVEGLVSKAPALTARDGSVARESQFFSINGRPVELPKVSRAIGDAWRSFEGTKKRPACVLCFSLPNNEYDVNLSPDKREVLLTHQDAICSSVFDAFTKLWSSQNDGNFAANGVVSQQEQCPPAQGKPDAVMPDVSSPEASPGKRRKMQRRGAFVHDFSMARLQHEVDQHEFQTRHVEVSAVTPVGLNTVSMNQEQVPAVPARVSEFSPTTDQVQQTMDTPMSETLPLAAPQRDRPGDEERLEWASIQSRFNTDGRRSQQDEIQALTAYGDAQQGAPITPEDPLFQEPKRTTTLTLEDFAFRPNNPVVRPRAKSTQKHGNKATFASLSVSTGEEKVDESSSDLETSHRKRPIASSAAAEQVGFDEPRKRQKAQPRFTIATQDLREQDENEGEQCLQPQEKTLVWDSFQGTDSIMKATKEARFSMRQFRKELRAISRSPPRAGEAVVGGIDESSGVEAADDNVVSLSKQDFRHMTVIGQFNLGFILAKCRNNHLWILDQHACDEKYNFERLCVTTVIHEQKLMAPMPLELSPSEESCILENMSVFEENGFRFAHDPEKPPRHRLALTALPHSGAHDGRKAVQFGKEDVHALCAMLSTEEGYSHQGGTGADGSGMYGNNAVRRHAGVSQQSQGDTASKVIARLPKAIAMFASRACRGSIMIGTALSRKEMETVVSRLADVDHPWNCPHGRPTMRHVKDLMNCMVQDEQRANAHISGPTGGVMTQATQEY